MRLRTDNTKGMGTRAACLPMIFKLAEYGSRTWRVLNGPALIQDVIAGDQFNDGIKSASPQNIAA